MVFERNAPENYKFWENSSCRQIYATTILTGDLDFSKEDNETVPM
jgi:hypothetical protein